MNRLIRSYSLVNPKPVIFGSKTCNFFPGMLLFQAPDQFLEFVLNK
jgi:hypothetical protein